MHEPIASGPEQGFWHGLAALIVAMDEAIRIWRDRSVARRRLRALDERMLKDFGHSRCDAEGEGCKPFWQP